MGREGGKIKPGGVRAGGEKKGEGFPLPPEFRRPGSSFVPLGVLACGLNVVGGERTRPGTFQNCFNAILIAVSDTPKWRANRGTSPP